MGPGIILTVTYVCLTVVLTSVEAQTNDSCVCSGIDRNLCELLPSFNPRSENDGNYTLDLCKKLDSCSTKQNAQICLDAKSGQEIPFFINKTLSENTTLVYNSSSGNSIIVEIKCDFTINDASIFLNITSSLKEQPNNTVARMVVYCDLVPSNSSTVTGTTSSMTPTHTTNATGTTSSMTPTHTSNATGTTSSMTPMHTSNATGTTSSMTPTHTSNATGTTSSMTPMHTSNATGTTSSMTPTHTSNVTRTTNSMAPSHTPNVTATTMTPRTTSPGATNITSTSFFTSIPSTNTSTIAPSTSVPTNTSTIAPSTSVPTNTSTIAPSASVLSSSNFASSNLPNVTNEPSGGHHSSLSSLVQVIIAVGVTIPATFVTTILLVMLVVFCLKKKKQKGSNYVRLAPTVYFDDDDS